MRAISPKIREIYEFGGFRFDFDERTIERVDGLSVDPPPEKTLQILALLVSRRGHLVTKDEILEQIWPNSFVEDNNVEKRISYLRQFLGKTESGGKFIETVRGQGYRFVGRVNVVEVSGTWLPETFRLPDEDKYRKTSNGDHVETNGSLLNVERVTDDKRHGARFGSSRKVVIACVAAASVVIAVVAGYFAFVSSRSVGSPRTIVVLPVGPINSADRSELYEFGIADSIINRLSSMEGFTIRPLSSVRSYADASMDPISAGREQRADYVIASNYQVADGKIKVTAQLYNMASGKVDDTFAFQQDVADVFRAQDAIAADLANRLIERFNASTIRPAKTRGTTNKEAYGLYQQAMYLFAKRSPENTKKAVEYLDKAVGLDPKYAKAWAAKALALRGSRIYHEAAQIHEVSVEAIKKALAIDPDLSDAYSALCFDKLTYEYDFAGAEAACKQAILLDQDSSTAHNAYSRFLSFQGRHAEALSEISRAIDQEPASYVNKRDYGFVLYLSRRWDEAAAHYRRLLELEPADAVLYNDLIRTLEAQGKEAEAFEWFIRLLNMLKRDDQAIARYQAVYQTSGWRGVLLERAKDPNPGFPNGNNFIIACLYARAGENDKAFELLEASLREREWAMPMLQVSPQLDSVREDPRYADLVRRVEGN